MWINFYFIQKNFGLIFTDSLLDLEYEWNRAEIRVRLGLSQIVRKHSEMSWPAVSMKLNKYILND